MQALALVSLLPYFLAASAAILTSPSQLKTRTYDYIIVGGGTAGNVVANRLSENAALSVLVIEAGYDQSKNENAQIPLYCTTLAPNTPLDWNYTTTPQPGLNGRSIPYARGRALGGSSAINYLVYNRGSQDDWNNYARIAGDQTLNWNNMARYRSKNEDFTKPATNRTLTDEFIASAHYTTGPLSVSLPISSVSLDAPVIQTTKELAEFPYQQDMNAGNPIGVGWTQSTVLSGARSSSNSAYIQAFLSTRPNLTILTGAQATKIIQNGTSGGLPLFRQVQFATSSGVNPYTVTARKEIILAGGSFNSPQLLMLSGIGDKAQLSSLNIPTIVNLPSVGKNMSDHVLLANTFQINAHDTIQDWENSTNLPGELTQWRKNHSGVLGDPGFRQLAWLRMPPTEPIFSQFPDPTAGPTSAHYELIFGHGLFPGQPGDPGAEYMNILTNVISPVSRGEVSLASSDPFAHPIINPNLLGSDFDKYVLTYALKAARRYASSAAFKGYAVNPAAAYGGATSDADLEAYAATYSGTVWHPVGTAAMSPAGAPWGVINPDMTVKGTVGLSVIDASGIPYVPTGHTQGPVYLWAERGADAVKARASALSSPTGVS